jgi:hypothetical protein
MGNFSAEFRIPDSEFRTRTSDFGLRTLLFRLRTSDFGLRTLLLGPRTPDIGLRTSDFGLSWSKLTLLKNHDRSGNQNGDVKEGVTGVRGDEQAGNLHPVRDLIDNIEIAKIG